MQALPSRLHGEIAQLVEHTTENRGVPGSSPGLAIPRLDFRMATYRPGAGATCGELRPRRSASWFPGFESRSGPCPKRLQDRTCRRLASGPYVDRNGPSAFSGRFSPFQPRRRRQRSVVAIENVCCRNQPDRPDHPACRRRAPHARRDAVGDRHDHREHREILDVQTEDRGRLRLRQDRWFRVAAPTSPVRLVFGVAVEPFAGGAKPPRAASRAAVRRPRRRAAPRSA